MTDPRFQQAFDQYLALRGRFAAGQITRDQFEAALQQSMVQDAQGRYWVIGAGDGKWYVYNNAAWVEAQPPAGYYNPPLPAPVQPQARATTNVALMLAVAGTIVGVVLVGAIALVLASSQGLVRIGQAAPTNTPFIPGTPISYPLSSPTPVIIVVTATSAPTPVAPTATPLPPATAAPSETPIPKATLSPTTAASDLVAQADKLALQSKFDDAAALYERAIAIDANSALAYARWARSLAYQGHLEMRDTLLFQAVNKAQTAGQLAPNDADVATWAARAYTWSEIYDKALTFAQKATLLAPSSADALAVLAEVELNAYSAADAERDASRAVQLNSNSAEAHRAMGLVYYARNQSASAVAEFERAAQLDPGLALRHMELGVMYRGAGNFPQATAALERSLSLYPRGVRAQAALGGVYRDQKLYDKSIQALNAALQVNQNSAELYAELGQTYLAAGQLSAAIDAARRGGALAPNNQNIKNLLTAISRAQGTPESPVAGAVPTVPSAPPGVYVSNISMDPPELKNGQMPTFVVTFLNTLGVAADYTWYVKLFEPDKKNSFGETAKSSNSLPPGNNPFSTFSNWKASGATPCRQFIARVFYVTKDSAVIEFPKPGGDTFSFHFTVCQ